MSYQAVNMVLANSKATGTDRLVLLVLASHADEETFECYPGRDLLCQEAAMSERNLIRCLRNLEELKEISIARGNGRGHITTYQITLDDTERVTTTTPFIKPERVTNSAQRVSAPSAFTVKKGDKSGNERVTDLGERVTNPVIKGDNNPDMYRTIMNQEETIMEPKKDMSGAIALAVPSPVQEVFSYWQSRLNHPTAHLTDKRRKLIQARLKEKYTVEEIKQAIDGCASSPFHMGQNDRGTVYDDIELICRDGGKLEGFIAKAKPSNGTLSRFTPNAQKTVVALESWLQRTEQEGQ